MAVEIFSYRPNISIFPFTLLYSLSVCEMGKVAPSGLEHLKPEVPIGLLADFLSLLWWLLPCGEKSMAFLLYRQLICCHLFIQ